MFSVQALERESELVNQRVTSMKCSSVIKIVVTRKRLFYDTSPIIDLLQKTFKNRVKLNEGNNTVRSRCDVSFCWKNENENLRVMIYHVDKILSVYTTYTCGLTTMQCKTLF